jgi:lysozyme family protein
MAAGVEVALTPFDRAFARTVGFEGKYCNNPDDSGGETCWGITKRTADAHGYTGDMRTLPIGVAKRIYQDSYWVPLCLDDIAKHMPRLAAELFDSAVLCGITRAGSWLQRALNGLNLRAALYGDIPVDGHVGQVTLRALETLLQHRNGGAELALLKLCDAQQACFLLDLCEQRQKDEAFLYGWVTNRVGV